jgi:hypothetical protein
VRETKEGYSLFSRSILRRTRCAELVLPVFYKSPSPFQRLQAQSFVLRASPYGEVPGEKNIYFIPSTWDQGERSLSLYWTGVYVLLLPDTRAPIFI